MEVDEQNMGVQMPYTTQQANSPMPQSKGGLQIQTNDTTLNQT